jgi:phosphoribosylaminoimidazolecarboxamide formyltransferase / IMP cyclohydrolase
VLRYGENPHQVGARYAAKGAAGWWETAVQHGGKAMSYLNVYDADAAWRLVHSLGDRPAAVVVKHANPCGVAVAPDVTTAYSHAHECDPVSAFGGIVAVNRPVGAAMAEALAPVFTEVVVAPGFEDDALLRLLEKRNLRVLEAAPPGTPGFSLRAIDGGYLVQTPDEVTVDRSRWQVVTKVAPTEDQWADLELAWRVVARVTSNAIVLVKDGQAVGIGCGQQNRRDAGRLAREKAAGRATGGAYASDAFFPFPDGLDGATEAGAATVIQPGGSIRDEEVIAAADERGLAMVFTGERHFRH